MWEIILGIGIIFLILEMFTPALFFINFALSCFVCAILSVYIKNIPVLIITFALLSIALLYLIRPFFIKMRKENKEKTGMEAKYIGKIAKVIEKIDSENGVISIYDERWQARSNEVIEAGQNAEIIGYDSLIMKVKKHEN